MTISQITANTLLEPYEADTEYPAFDNTVNKPYSLDEYLESGATVYRFLANTPAAVVWAADQESGYVDGQLVFKDSIINRVVKESNLMLNAPSANVDTKTYFQSIVNTTVYAPWIQAMQGTIPDFSLFNGFEDTAVEQFRGGNCILERSASSPTGWFSFMKYLIPATVYEAYLFNQTSYNIAPPAGSKVYAVATYNNVTFNLYNPDNAAVAPSMAYGEVLIDGAGTFYKVGGSHTFGTKPNQYTLYEIAKGSASTTEVTTARKSCVVTQGRGITPVTTAEIVGVNYLSQNVYRPTFFNFDTTNNIIYSIPKNNLPTDYTDNVISAYTIVENNEAFYLPNTYAFSSINALKPFDNKAYTALKNAGTFTMNVQFTLADTIALVGLKCDSVEVTVYDSTDTQVGATFTKHIDNTVSDTNTDILGYKTTEVLYFSEVVQDGRYEITFFGSNIELGGVHAGIKISSGFSNLVYTNKFNDYSVYEKDQWGNILYVSGVKTNVYSGTADILITNYDKTNRLFAMLGGETAIVNGSDNTDNAAADSKTVFSSTMVVGRVRGFSLKTKLDNKRMSQMATYNFIIEEDV